VRDLLLVVLTLFWGGAATPPASSPAPAAQPAPTIESEASPEASAARPRSVLVVGDSLAVGTEPYVSSALPGWKVVTSAETSRTTSDGVAEITGRGQLPPVIVVSLGTNDDPGAVASFERSVEEVIEAAGPGGCVVWPNIVRPPYNGVSYRGYNRALAGLSVTNPNLFVVDWAGMVAANPGWLAPDGVHATSTGYAARGEAIAQAVLSCGGVETGVPLGD
jgi:lysophospholipase L1-like esterase